MAADKRPRLGSVYTEERLCCCSLQFGEFVGVWDKSRNKTTVAKVAKAAQTAPGISFFQSGSQSRLSGVFFGICEINQLSHM